ncbi:MAG TPA: Clp protease N-terminal domain-containing protein [Acidimicrobiales bacterium]|nr:Clp protease N-terminal domain-containing protein [Acidimicrobiales bacterium]
MATFPVPLDNLIAYVRALHPDGGPLDHLAAAVISANRLDEQADALIGYFVDQARASGASWSEIGASMGVSKQAAQKRFVTRDEDLVPEGKAFSRFAPRARSAVAAAGQLAAAAGGAEVEVPHIAAGLLAEPDGLAARAIRRLGVTDETVFRTLGTGPAAGGYDTDPAALRELRFSDAAQEVMRRALKVALRFGHNYIGTEHLLLGVLAAGGPVADSLAAAGLGPQLVESAVDVELAEARLQRQRQAS